MSPRPMVVDIAFAADLETAVVEACLVSCPTSVRMAVYDLKEGGTFLGYKLDSGWRLDKSYWTDHTPWRAELDGNLVQSLLSLLNDFGPSPRDIQRRIDVEELPRGRVIAQYVVRRDPQTGKYIAENYDEANL